MQVAWVISWWKVSFSSVAITKRGQQLNLKTQVPCQTQNLFQNIDDQFITRSPLYHEPTDGRLSIWFPSSQSHVLRPQAYMSRSVWFSVEVVTQANHVWDSEPLSGWLRPAPMASGRGSWRHKSLTGWHRERPLAREFSCENSPRHE